MRRSASKVQRALKEYLDVQSSDHCELSVFFRVKGEAAPDHTCGKGMCASKMSLVWTPEHQQA